LTKRGSAVVLALVLLAACGTVPPAEAPPLAAPRVATSVRHAAGSPLAGSAPGRQDAGEPEQALQVLVTLFALERLPDAFLPLASLTRLVASPDAERPLLAASRLATGARVSPKGYFRAEQRELKSGITEETPGGRAAFLTALRGALPVGVTATFEAARDAACCGLACEPVHERLAVHAFRSPLSPGDVEVTLDLESTLAPCAGMPRPRPERELLVLEPRLRPGSTITLFVPSPFDGEEARAIAAVVQVLPPPDALTAAPHREAFAACLADLAREEALVLVRARIAAEPVPTLPDVSGARATLASPTLRRGALLRIARACGAHLAEDVALSGDDGLVEGVARRLLARLEHPRTGLTLGEIAWVVERESMAAMRERLTGDEAPAEVSVLVLERGGGAGRSLGTFFALADASTSLADFERRLAAENQELLEDAAPGLRSRAYDWLAARHRAPPGYDPLASAASRRAALERFADAGKATAPGGGP
jgi:hypothetical protein